MGLKLLLLILFSVPARAEFAYLGRSPEGLLMGDAYTAVADDEHTLFYNPAALGRHQGVSIIPLAPSVQGPDVFDKDIGLDRFNLHFDKRFENFSSEVEDIANRILGIPLYIQLGMTPTLKMRQLALSFFVNSKFNTVLENAIHPELSLDSRVDHGAILGYAFSFGHGARTRDGTVLSIGLAAKHFYRQGIKGRFALMGPELLSILNDSGENIDSVKRALGYSKGDGRSYDIGVEQVWYTPTSRWVLGASLLDIGDSKLKRTEGFRELPPQEMSLNLGASWRNDTSFVDSTFAVDYSNVFDPMTPNWSKLKLGGRIRLPFLDLYSGFNGGHFSWGLGMEWGLFSFKVGFYGIETGGDFKSLKASRVALSLDLLSARFGRGHL